MKIQKINYTSRNINFRNNDKRQIQPPSPVKEGLKTAGVWLGFGLGFDFICRKFVVFKNSPIKNSLFINSVLAVLAGGITCIKNLSQIKRNVATYKQKSSSLCSLALEPIVNKGSPLA